MPPIFPQVKHYKAEGGRFMLRGARLWHGSAVSSFMLGLLRDSQPGLDIKPGRALPAMSLALSVDEPAFKPSEFSREAYRLRVSPQMLQLEAGDARGLTHGIFSLKQWIAAELDSLPCGEVNDSPDLAVRAYHLDLKGSMWRQEVLLDRLMALAELKINMLVVEYEDKFPFASHPDLVSPDALSKAELAEFLALAKNLNIEVVPLLQCFGHVEYILKHAAYAALGEIFDPADAPHHLPAGQFCPLNKNGQALFEDLALELLAAHPDTLWFHMGADEARDLGRCPECAAEVKKHGKEELYLSVLRRSCAFLEREGKEAMVWDDMFRDMEPLKKESLPKNLAFNYWLYYTDPRLAESEAYPFLQKLKSWEHPIFGASCVRGADGAGPELPDMRARLDNNLSWAQVAKKEKLAGLLMTSWARYTSLTMPCEAVEGAWPAVALSAAFAWGVPAEGGDKEALYLDALKAYLRAFHGINSAEAAKIILEFRKAAFVPAKLGSFQGARHAELWGWLKRFEESHAVLDSIERLVTELDMRFDRISAFHVDANERAFYLAKLKKASDALLSLEDELRPLLGHLFRAASVREYMASRLDRWRYRLTSFMVMLSKESRAGSDKKAAATSHAGAK